MTTFDVRLGGHEGGLRGTLKLGNDGLSWNSQNGDRRITVNKSDAESAEWFRTGPKHFQFRVRQSDNVQFRFDGFDERDQKTMQNFCKDTLGVPFKVEKLDVQGKNAGKFECVGEDLVFKVFTTSSKTGEIVGERRAFDVSLASVKNAQVNSNKDEILLEFSQTDNGAGRKNECFMTEMRFYVPNSIDAEDDDGSRRTVEILHRDIMQHVVLEATGAQIAKLESIKCKYPRSTFEISLYDSVFKMHGQSYDFSIKYKNISRLIMVPNPSSQVYLVICLIEPERKGGTQYSAIVAVFDPLEHADVAVTLPADFNSKYRDVKNKELVKPKMSGPYHETVCTLLQVFSSTASKPMKVHKHGKFRANLQKDHFGESIGCVKCSVAANTGYLYLLDNCFVFLEKPPLVFMYDNVDSITWDIEQKSKIQAQSLSFKIKLDNKKAQEFSTIPKAEVKNMNAFFEAISKQKYEGKKMVIANYDDDDEEDDKGDDKSDDDRHIKNRLQADADEDESSEDEDFKGSGASDDSDESEDDSEGSDDDEEKKPDKGKSSKKSSSKPKSKDKDRPKKSKGSDDGSDDDDDEPRRSKDKEKPKKAKKDPNAPKKPKSAWLFFCDAMRDKVKAENPGIAFTEINAVISKKWNALSESEKKPYEDMARKSASQYKEDKAKYDEEHPELSSKAAKAAKKRKSDGDDDGGGKGKGDGKAKKAKKDPNAPKRGQNAFMLFSNAMRDKVRKDKPSMAVKDVAREIGAMWQALGAEEKKKWEEKSKEDKERYKRESDAYQKAPKSKAGPTVEEFSKMGDGSDDSDQDSDAGAGRSKTAAARKSDSDDGDDSD